MHKRKGVFANSSALLSLKLCIFFRPFLYFFAIFYLFPPFFNLFYPFSTFSSLIFRSVTFLLYPFYSFLFLKPFYNLFYLFIISFISLYSLLPFILALSLLLFPYYLFYPCSCLLYLCVFPLLYLLLFRCSDYSSDVSISL